MSDEKWNLARNLVDQAAARLDAHKDREHFALPQPARKPFEPLVGPLTPRPDWTLAQAVLLCPDCGYRRHAPHVGCPPVDAAPEA